MSKPLTIAAALAAGAVALAASAQPPKAAPPPAAAATIDRSVLHVQVILDKLGFGPGVLNGRAGKSLTNALSGFQESRGLPRTGKPDAATLRALGAYRGVRPTIEATLDADAFRGPFVAIPKGYADQARLDRMGYSRPLERIAERFHTTPAVLVALNPRVTTIRPGTTIVVPNSLPTSRAYPADATPEWRATLAGLNVDAAAPKAERIEVSKSRGVLQAFDAEDRLIAQYTATIGSARDPLPIGDWKVLHISPNPDWKMNPAILKGVSDDKAAQVIPPGPNNPVGVVWIDLSKEHYGIHGTPNPEKIGLAESNGCVRLTNWDAARVALMVRGGTPVIFRR